MWTARREFLTPSLADYVAYPTPQEVDYRIVTQDEGFGAAWDIRFDRRDGLQVDKGTVEIQAEVFVPTPEDVKLPVKVLTSDPGKIAELDD
jgi:hypothetical protein